MRLLLILIILLIPIPLPTLLPIPTKASRKGRENKTLEASYDKEFIELGVKPFSSLTPDTSNVRFNHATFNQRPWQGLVPAGGRATMSSRNEGGKALRSTHGVVKGVVGVRDS